MEHLWQSGLLENAWSILQLVAVAAVAGWVTERLLDTGVRTRGLPFLSGLFGLYVGPPLLHMAGWPVHPYIAEQPLKIGHRDRSASRVRRDTVDKGSGLLIGPAVRVTVGKEAEGRLRVISVLANENQVLEIVCDPAAGRLLLKAAGMHHEGKVDLAHALVADEDHLIGNADFSGARAHPGRSQEIGGWRRLLGKRQRAGAKSD